MKSSYCDLTEQEIAALPKRFHGFLFSPFQFNRKAGWVMVPEETFKEMTDIIVEYAKSQGAADASSG